MKEKTLSEKNINHIELLTEKPEKIYAHKDVKEAVWKLKKQIEENIDLSNPNEEWDDHILQRINEEINSIFGEDLK